jgi:L-iditol 2-dehydrogenase
MRQVRLVADRELVVEDAPVPEVRAGEALVRISAVGICGSDVHAYHGRHPFVHPPIVLGHEFGGTVTAMGSPAEGVKVGQTVTVEPSVVCGVCENCRRGRYNICAKLQVLGCLGWQGAQAEYIRVPASKIIPLPRTWSGERGALVEPTAVAVHAVRQGRLATGHRVVVLGAGPIGLMTVQAAKALGAAEVAVVDLVPARLERARALGADHALQGGDGVVAAAHRLWGAEGVDLVFDCVAVAQTVDQALRMARKGIRVVVVGVPAGTMPVDLSLVQDRELELVGTLMYRREDFTEAIRLMEAGKMAPEQMVTHRLPLEQAADAFRLIDAQPDRVCKVVLVVGGDGDAGGPH